MVAERGGLVVGVAGFDLVKETGGVAPALRVEHQELRRQQFRFAPIANTCRNQSPGEKLLSLDGQSEDIAPAHHLFVHVVKDEIPQAIDDQRCLS